MGNVPNADNFFLDKGLSDIIHADYLVLKFQETCVIDFGFGKSAPYRYFRRPNEHLHLISVGGVHIDIGQVGVYTAGRIVKYQFPDDFNSRAELMTTVVPVMKLPDRFQATMSRIGDQCCGFANFGTNAEYSVKCILDFEQYVPGVFHRICQNTQCVVSIKSILFIDGNVPAVSVVVHEII